MTTTTTPLPASQDGLRATLERLVQSGADPNPAFDALLADYARYHLVLAIIAGAFLVAFAVAARSSWRRMRRAATSADGGSAFPRLTYLAATLSSVGVGLFLAVILVANVSTAVDPRPGFAGAVALVGAPGADPSRAELDHGFDQWLHSGSTEMPDAVAAAIDDRLAWQRPKAAVSALLLLAFVVVGARLWRSLLEGRRRATHWRAGDLVRLGAGVGLVAGAFVLMLMVMGNTQASVAPVAMTLFYG